MPHSRKFYIKMAGLPAEAAGLTLKSQPALVRGRASADNLLRRLERVTGIEPVSAPWQGAVLPLYDTRKGRS